MRKLGERLGDCKLGNKLYDNLESIKCSERVNGKRDSFRARG